MQLDASTLKALREKVQREREVFGGKSLKYEEIIGDESWHVKVSILIVRKKKEGMEERSL